MPPAAAQRNDPEDWDDGWDDEVEPDDEPTVPCPYCRREIHEDAQRCPYCGQYVSEEDAPPAARPAWILLGVVLALAVVLFWILG